MSDFMERALVGEEDPSNEDAEVVLGEGCSEFATIISASSPHQAGGNGGTESVSIECSSLGQGGEMLINTIEVSTEELMSMGHINSEEIEFIYSPNIQFNVESIGNNSVEEQEAGDGVQEECGIGGMELVPISVPEDKEKLRNEEEISKAILEAASNIICENAPKRMCGTKGGGGGRRKGGGKSGSNLDFIITSVQGAYGVQPDCRPMDGVQLNTIDGKLLSLEPGSKVFKGGPVVENDDNAGGVMLSPAIIETATAAHQTVAAALLSQNAMIDKGLEGEGTAERKRNRLQIPIPMKIEVIGGPPLQLQKYYCQPGLCRVCLLVKKNLTSIFEDVTIDSNGLVENARGPNASHKFNLLAALKTLLDIDVQYNDGLPEQICVDCYDQLMNFSVYRKRISIGHSKLNQILEQVKNSTAPTFIPSIGETDIQTTDIYRFPSSIVTANNIIKKSQYSHLVLRNLSDRTWDKIFSSLSVIVGYKSGKLKFLESYACQEPYVTGFFCYSCNTTIHGTKEDYAQHCDEFHGIASPEDVLYPCDVCGNKYPFKDTSSGSQSYPEHWLKHFFLYECDLCSKKLPSAKGLWVHKKSAHRTREKLFSCDEENCHKSFFTQSHLDAHKRIHGNSHQQTEDLHYCPLCGKGLCNSSNLEAHIITVHSSNRIWQCDICQKQFKRKEILICHREAVHLNKKYKCQICGEDFTSQSSKAVHILRHKGEKRHTCTVCSKQFFSTFGLKSHMLKHQETGDYTCQECGKSFKRASYLEEHNRTHTGEKPFNCPICDKAIRMKSNYFKHLRIHRRKNEVTPQT